VKKYDMAVTILLFILITLPLPHYYTENVAFINNNWNKLEENFTLPHHSSPSAVERIEL